MTLRERYYMAKYGDTSAWTRFAIFISIILLFISPGLIFQNFMSQNLPPIGNSFLAGSVVWSVGGVIGALILFILSLIVGLIGWIITGDFEGIQSMFWELLLDTFDFIWNVFCMVFGSYDNKWFFLKEWFSSDKIAKEVLGKK